jgi:hypothetical protein
MLRAAWLQQKRMLSTSGTTRAWGSSESLCVEHNLCVHRPVCRKVDHFRHDLHTLDCDLWDQVWLEKAFLEEMQDEEQRQLILPLATPGYVFLDGNLQNKACSSFPNAEFNENEQLIIELEDLPERKMKRKRSPIIEIEQEDDDYPEIDRLVID